MSELLGSSHDTRFVFANWSLCRHRSKRSLTYPQVIEFLAGKISNSWYFEISICSVQGLYQSRKKSGAFKLGKIDTWVLISLSCIDDSISICLSSTSFHSSFYAWKISILEFCIVLMTRVSSSNKVVNW